MGYFSVTRMVSESVNRSQSSSGLFPGDPLDLQRCILLKKNRSSVLCIEENSYLSNRREGV